MTTLTVTATAALARSCHVAWTNAALRPLQTPCILTETRRGFVPHLIDRVLPLSDAAPFRLALEDLTPLVALKKPFKTLAHVEPQRPCLLAVHALDSPRAPSHREIVLTTSFGLERRSFAQYAQAADSLAADAVVAPFVTVQNASTKAARDAQRVNARFMAEFMPALDAKRPTAVFAALTGNEVGACRAALRSMLAAYPLASAPAASAPRIVGAYLPYLYGGESPSARAAVISAIASERPPQWLILAPAHSLLDIVDAVSAGADVIESRYAMELTDHRLALNVPFRELLDLASAPPATAAPAPALRDSYLINMLDRAHALSSGTLPHGVGSELACYRQSLGYLYHLMDTQEMLGEVMLAQHNLYQLRLLEETLRAAIERDALPRFSALLEAALLTPAAGLDDADVL